MPTYRFKVRDTDGNDLGTATYQWLPAGGDHVRIQGNREARALEVNEIRTLQEGVEPAHGILVVELL